MRALDCQCGEHFEAATTTSSTGWPGSTWIGTIPRCNRATSRFAAWLSRELTTSGFLFIEGRGRRAPVLLRASATLMLRMGVFQKFRSRLGFVTVTVTLERR